jgi:Rod binding domain-containing protein
MISPSADIPSPAILPFAAPTPALSHSGNSAQVPSAPESPTQRKLRAAAAEFESLLISNLWKSMKSSFAAPDDDSTDPGHDTLEEMGIQAMCNAVGKAGGFGLGKLILKHLEPQLATSNHPAQPPGSNVFGPPADIPP